MKKKKQSSTSIVKGATEIAGNSSSINVDDIKTLVKDHATFFDKLVELIPAKFYLPTNDDDKPWFQGLSKAKKAEAKLKSIENTKKSRRDRLDPEKSSKTTLDLLKESLESEKLEKRDDDEDEDEDEDDEGGLKEDNRSVTYEELRQRLRRRIEELRGGRGDGSGEGKRRKAERREMKDGRKRKRGENVERGASEAAKKESGKSEVDIEKDASEAAKGIEFGKVKLAASNDDGHKKKRRLSKEKELERALKLEEAMKDPEKGNELAKKHSWKSATERAMGGKVHDNPKILKKSLQKDKKKHDKSVEKWKQRVETTEKMKQGKQAKRRENIKAKSDKKKQAKIEKREKKLMRPGFEGRKEGFVTGN